MCSGPLSRKHLLVLDDRPRHLGQGAAPLLDRFDQPLGRLDLAFEKLAVLGVGRAVAVHVDVALADVDVRRPVVEQPDLVFAGLAELHDDVGDHVGNVVGRELGAGLGVEVLEHLDRFLDGFDVEAGPFLNDRQAIVLDVLQMVLDQQAQHVAVRRLRRHLQQQAFLEIAGADAGRIELLDDAQGGLDLLGGRGIVEALGDLLGGEGMEALVLIGVAEVADRR